ncbi:MAG: HAD-IIA family hydrolase [Promethearchaeota archaeon]
MQIRAELRDKELFIFDLDGVIYRASSPIPEAIKFLSLLKQNDKKYVFLTNNSSKTREMFSHKLKAFNIEVDPSDIFTSAYLAADFLSTKFPGGSAFLIGELGMYEIMKKAGFCILNEEDPEIIDMEILPPDIRADFVLVGWDRHVTYNKFRCAMMLIQKGAKFYATNTDTSFPGPDSFWPGAGALVAFLQTALQHPPKKIFGKPDPSGINLILRKFEIQKERAVMIGDRLTTDILAGNRARITTVAVETGIHKRDHLNHFSNDCTPTLFVSSLSELIF